jgi:hypothetical protein
MRRAFVALYLILGTGIALFGKGTTTRITITGGTLREPVQITDAAVLRNFSVWDWARPSHDGFIVAYSNRSLPDPPKSWPRYEVAFYTDAADHPSYVVSYQFSPSRAQGFVFIPRSTLNSSTIMRNGVEDWWLPASSGWEQVARPLIAQATRR